MLDKIREVREHAAHHLAHPLTLGETCVHGVYFGSLYFGVHEFYVIAGGVLFLVVVVRVVLGALE